MNCYAKEIARTIFREIVLYVFIGSAVFSGVYSLANFQERKKPEQPSQQVIYDDNFRTASNNSHDLGEVVLGR